MIIVSFDPGGTTGIAVHDTSKQLNDLNAYLTSTVTTMEELVTVIEPGISQIIYERFQAKIISSYGLHTVRLVGAIEAVAFKLGIKCVGQMPAFRKPFLKKAEQMLNRAGYPYVIHEKDALAHLLYWEYRNTK